MDPSDPHEDRTAHGAPEPEPAEASPLRWSTLGIEFALGIVLLGFLGWLADGALGWIESFPFCTVAGVLLGFGWGIWRLQRALNERKPPRP